MTILLSPHTRLCIAAFLFDFAVMACLTATPFFVSGKLDGGPEMSGLLGGLQSVGYAAMCFGSAWFVRHLRNGLHAAIAGGLFFMVLMGAMPLFRVPWICCLFGVIGFMGMALVWPALHSWVGAETDPHVRAKRMRGFNMSWGLGFAFSPLLAGPLYDIHYYLPYAALMVFCLAAVILVASLPHEREKIQSLEAAPSTGDREEHERASEAMLYASWVAVAVTTGIVAAARSVYALHVEQMVNSGELRLLWENTPPGFLTRNPATNFSFASFAVAFTMAMTFLIMGVTQWWRHRISALVLSQIAASAACWAMGRTTSLLVITASMSILGVALGVTFFASTFYSLANQTKKHGHAAFNEAWVGIGGFVFSAAYGWMAEPMGVTWPFMMTPCFVAVAVAIQIWLARRSGLALRAR